MVSAVWIPVSSGRYFTLVSREDEDVVRQYTWCARPRPNGSAYVFASVSTKPGPRNVALHRLLLGVLDKPDVLVDHINMDRLDNRRENLRLCTPEQNRWNSHGRRPDGLKGVRNLKNGRFEARIQVGGRAYALGCYATAEEAARAWDEGARKYQGEFARLNFPDARA